MLTRQTSTTPDAPAPITQLISILRIRLLLPALGEHDPAAVATEAARKLWFSRSLPDLVFTEKPVVRASALRVITDAWSMVTLDLDVTFQLPVSTNWDAVEPVLRAARIESPLAPSGYDRPLLRLLDMVVLAGVPRGQADELPPIERV